MLSKYNFIPTRAHALERLEEFIKEAKNYSVSRNYVSEHLSEVSVLSPYINTRIILESEVIRAVLDKYDFDSVEKFIQELCWRSYWQNYLRINNSIWREYTEIIKASDVEKYEDIFNRNIFKENNTFLKWYKELKTHGYLHNHIRMYFASIWVHTLKLPWYAGASIFMKYLLDADAASNTLSWRWIAGLHTKGKYYLAKKSNIEHHTGSEFIFDNKELAIEPNEQIDFLNKQNDFSETIEASLDEINIEKKLLITEENLCIDRHLEKDQLSKLKLIILSTDYPYRDRNINLFKSNLVINYAQELKDKVKSISIVNTIEDLIIDANLEMGDNLSVITPQVGYAQDFLNKNLRNFKKQITYLRNPWDEFTEIDSVTGFFNYWKKIKMKLIKHFDTNL
jgi:deoxyribodipyrimidine photo-lyase